MESKNQQELYLKAKYRVERIKGFYVHVAVYLVINIAIIFGLMRFWGLNNWSPQFWSLERFSTAIIWGIGVVIHAGIVFKAPKFFGYEWEKRKLEKFMNEE